MKNPLLKIKGIFKKNNLEVASSINPHKHWVILLWFFFGVVIVLIMFSLFLLYQIKNDQIFQVAPTVLENNQKIKEDLLKNVTDSFNQKAEKESELKTNAPVYKDPSL